MDLIQYQVKPKEVVLSFTLPLDSNSDKSNSSKFWLIYAKFEC
jgi:hypothetical protein